MNDRYINPAKLCPGSGTSDYLLDGLIRCYHCRKLLTPDKVRSEVIDASPWDNIAFLSVSGLLTGEVPEHEFTGYA